ncbi:hypothetical protein L1887_18574 [Cichorium endivia]|nr:hypothetical protein L1887_18574 [Cichorium endivia]
MVVVQCGGCALNDESSSGGSIAKLSPLKGPVISDASSTGGIGDHMVVVQCGVCALNDESSSGGREVCDVIGGGSGFLGDRHDDDCGFVINGGGAKDSARENDTRRDSMVGVSMSTCVDQLGAVNLPRI